MGVLLVLRTMTFLRWTLRFRPPPIQLFGWGMGNRFLWPLKRPVLKWPSLAISVRLALGFRWRFLASRRISRCGLSVAALSRKIADVIGFLEFASGHKPAEPFSTLQRQPNARLRLFIRPPFLFLSAPTRVGFH